MGLWEVSRERKRAVQEGGSHWDLPNSLPTVPSLSTSNKANDPRLLLQPSYPVSEVLNWKGMQMFLKGTPEKPPRSLALTPLTYLYKKLIR